VLRPLEVDDAIAALVAAALVARRDAAVVVAAALLRHRREQALLRLRLRDLVERRDRHETTARRGGLVATDRHQICAPPKISIVSPARSCTTAFFQPGRVPRWRPRRFGFAGIEMTLTPVTLTSNSSSIACRICVLCASP